MADRILIVDDDIDTLRLVGLMLQRQGYQILAANHGAQAIALAKKEKPDLILLDVMMPDMDGFEVTRRLRADPETEIIPIIMFTAKTQIDDKVTGFESGADDYLTKPTHPAELLAHVKALLARSKKLRQAAQPAEAVSPRKRGKVIGVLAAKGGLGVTTVALNLGVSLRKQSGQSVVVADFRPGQGSLGIMLGYTRPAGINTLLTMSKNGMGAREVEGQLVSHGSGVRLLLSSPRPADAQQAQTVQQFGEIARHLAYLADYIILDLGPSLPPLTRTVLGHCDQVLVVVEPVPGTIAQTRLLLEDLGKLGFGPGRVDIVLLNRTRSSVQASWTQVQEQLGRKVAVVLSPAPELAYQAENNNAPMVLLQPDSLSAQQYAKLAEVVSST